MNQNLEIKEKNKNFLLYEITSTDDIILLKSKFVISSLNSFVMGLCLSFGTMNNYVFPNYLEFTNKSKLGYIFRTTSTTMLFYMSTLIIRHLNKREKIHVQNNNCNLNLGPNDKLSIIAKDGIYKLLLFFTIFKTYYFKNTFPLTIKSNFKIFLCCAYMIDLHELYKDLNKI